MGTDQVLARVTEQLRRAGCVAAEAEAVELVEAAGGDAEGLDELVARRSLGEPLAWLVGSMRFCDEVVGVEPGVFVPRLQSEQLAIEAAARLPPGGLAVDLCTGAGAIAVVLVHRRPSARVVATEIDPLAVACARANGIEVYEGDMAAAVPDELWGRADVVTAIVPYVPTDALRLLPRDVIAYEPRLALDGGVDGTRLLARAVREAAGLLRRGGSLVVELGGDQAERIRPVLDETGYHDVELFHDEDHDLRALAARH